MSFASQAAVYDPFYIAIEKGYFAEQGLQIDMVTAGGGAATPSLISGELALSTSPASALPAMFQGAPLKIIMVNGDRQAYWLWSSSPSIQSLNDLVGKSVGVITRGDTLEISCRVLLQEHGIDPNTVSFTALGSTAAIATALDTGVLPAGVLGETALSAIGGQPKNGVQLADLEQEVQLLYNGVVTTQEELQRNPDDVKAFLLGSMKGRAYFQAYRDQSIAILDKYTGLTPDKDAIDYDQTVGDLTVDGTAPDQALREDALARAAVVDLPEAQVPPVSQLYDFTLVREVNQELADSGWTPTP